MALEYNILQQFQHVLADSSSKELNFNKVDFQKAVV
jgi:hypothetical protein